MALVLAKCLNCGANLKVDDKSKSGVCEHCGARYITEDVIVNNITNINYTEIIDGVDINRSAVLEKMLLEYYAGKFNDIDNLKEYALRIQEYEINNPLAHFVVFENIDSSICIKKLLCKSNLNICLDLFVVFLNICGDDLNNPKIVQNIVKYENKMEKLDVIRKIINDYRIKDLKFILSVIYAFKLTESDNDIILQEIYENKKTNKIAMLSQLKLFTVSHKDFTYNKQKFDEYFDHWKNLKDKQKLMRQQAIDKYNLEQENKLKEINTPYKKEKSNKVIISLGVGVLIVLLAIVIISFMF